MGKLRRIPLEATKILSEEHRLIERYLVVLEKITGQKNFAREDVSDLTQILDFIRTFADRCHHGKEEEFLFPMLEQRGIPKEGGPIGMMLLEHEEGRKYVAGFARALEDFKKGQNTWDQIQENAQAYIGFLRNHIPKEDNILYPQGAEVLNEADDQKLLVDFERIEKERIEPGVHEKFHCLLKELEEKWR